MGRLEILKYYLLAANVVCLMYTLWVLQTGVTWPSLKDDRSIELFQIFYSMLLLAVCLLGFFGTYRESMILLLLYCGIIIMSVFGEVVYYVYCYLKMNYGNISLKYCVHFGWLNMAVQASCGVASYHIQDDITDKLRKDRADSQREAGDEISEEKQEEV